KVMHHFETPEGEQERELVAPMDLAPVAVQEVVGIEGFTRFCNTEGSLSYEDEAFYENIRFADASFFDMFPLGLRRGSYAGFQDRQSIYLSDALAAKYFGDDDPVGRS